MRKIQKPSRLPGQMPPKEGDSILEQQKRETLSTMYGIFRSIFEQQCIQLGVQEYALMEYGEDGIKPTVKPRGFPENQTDQRHKFMEQRLVDFHQMTKKEGKSLVTNAIDAMEQQVIMLREMINMADRPPAPVTPPILGADGIPVSSDKSNEQKPLASGEASA